MQELQIVPGKMTLEQLRLVSRKKTKITLDPNCKDAVEKSVETVRDVINSGRVIYGINTGFGLLANTVIPNDELEHLQRSIVLSHAAGIGDFMSESTTRLLMVLKMLGV